MKEENAKKITLTAERAFALADQFYESGEYERSLQWCFNAINGRLFDYPDAIRDACVRIVDCYEAMGLNGSAVQWLYAWLHTAYELEWTEDLPEIYEGLAVNYLNMGKEAQSAYYYNKLIDVDATLPPEAKFEIADTFAKPKSSGFRFVYPPRLADYSKVLEQGSRALKEGDGKRAVQYFSQVEKGSKEYSNAQEMQAVAHLLCGEVDEAQAVCEGLLEETPNDVRALATLCAVYLEKGETGKSRRIADALCQMSVQTQDEIYKVATVCCENGLHDEAYKRFVQLEKETPYDGRTLYFKAVSSWKSGRYKEAERTLDRIATTYPYAEVAKYYLSAVRAYNQAVEDGKTASLELEPSYFYCLPQAEREGRCQELIALTHNKQDEAWYTVEELETFVRWCFDEMDGADHELQYLGMLVAYQCKMEDILEEVALNPEVLDAFKIELLRLRYEENAEREMDFVLCDIYRQLKLLPIKIGAKRKRKFVRAYAKVASKFAPINDGYGKKLQSGAEALYLDMQARGALNFVDNEDDLACAIFVFSGIKEVYGSFDAICAMLDGKPERVQRLLYGKEESQKEEG